MFTHVRGNHNFDCIKITACVPSSSCFGRNYFHVNALHTNLPMSYIAHLLEEEIFVICLILKQQLEEKWYSTVYLLIC